MREFLKGLPKRFKVGVVAFSETAEVAAPATADRQLAIDAIDYLYPQRGTAIGDGIARGVEVARAAEADNPTGIDRACGDPDALGRVADGGDPAPDGGSGAREVVQDPRLHDRPRHSGGVVEFTRFGGTRIIPVPPDKDTLRRIASATGGRFYEAENIGDLRDAYGKMGSLVSKVERKQEVTFAFLAGGLVLLLAAAASAAVTFPRLP